MKNKDEQIQIMKNRIDDYNNTVYAIIGFLNTFKFELAKTNKDVCLFQGRKFFLDPLFKNIVTPDLGIAIAQKEGVIGEVKYSFPSNRALWEDDFKQLKKYESIQTGWPTNSGGIPSYDIVLLVQQNRSRDVKDYYLNEVKEEDKIKKKFAIIEFNRASQGKEYFHFRIEYGSISNSAVQKKLYSGLYIPFDIFMSLYAKIQIYDVEPTMPLMLMYIYESVVNKVIEEGSFKKMTKKSSQSVKITSQEITSKLNSIYSFKSIHAKKFTEHQPEFPKLEWVKRALDQIAKIGEGTWTNKELDEFTYILSQKEKNILEHYIGKTAGDEMIQAKLF